MINPADDTTVKDLKEPLEIGKQTTAKYAGSYR